jgi:hypothetical protein
LGTAAKGLQEASLGFNANTVQFGLAAGGVVLSGIGIATNSQFLVYAGMTLQMAGMAIQLYEALSSTITTTTMTMAAGALTAAAFALMAAAAVDAIPFFHQGGVVYAHAGWPRLRSDEVPIIAQTGERVLSRQQNRDYEAGKASGGGGAGNMVVHYAPVVNAIDARGVEAVLAKHGKAMVRIINKSGGVGTRGQKLGSGRY